MNIKIYGTVESADTNPKREWEFLDEVSTLSKAKQSAKRISKKKKWYEVELQGFNNENEKIHHSYWRNGKLEIDMYI